MKIFLFIFILFWSSVSFASDWRDDLSKLKDLERAEIFYYGYHPDPDFSEWGINAFFKLDEYGFTLRIGAECKNLYDCVEKIILRHKEYHRNLCK